MADLLAKVRKKCRLIAEVRFQPVPEFFDMRGHVIASILPHVKARLSEWQSDGGNVTFGDEPTNPVNQFSVSFNRISVMLEDPGTVEEFSNVVSQYLGYAYEVMGKHLSTIERFGVRVIGVHIAPDAPTFKEVVELTRSRLHILPDSLPLKYTDAMVRLIHENGAFYVGPTKQKDPWLKSVFLEPEDHVPEVGVGIDVDSFVQTVKVGRVEDLRTCFRSALDMTTSTEEALARHLGLIGDVE